MKFVVLLCVMVAAVMATDVKYTDKYDNPDLDEMLGNRRLFTITNHVNCFKCTPEGMELKDRKKCTEAQEKEAYRVIEYLIKNELETWRELAAKCDPTGKWRKTYEDRAKANGIVIPNKSIL